MSEEIPKPICQICGVEQKMPIKDDMDMVVYAHYGVFCMKCMFKYEWRFKQLCQAVCKAEVEIIKTKASDNKDAG